MLAWFMLLTLRDLKLVEGLYFKHNFTLRVMRIYTNKSPNELWMNHSSDFMAKG